MGIDTNSAPKQKVMGDLIPANTIVPAVAVLRGRKETKAKDGEMLDFEYTISGGEFEKRKIWDLMMISGNGSDGHNEAVDITMSRVRAMLESAFNINPDDDSDEAMEGRRIEDWEELDGLEVLIKVGIEKSKDPQYPDKNRILAFITPDMDGYEDYELDNKRGRKKPAGKAPAKGGAKGGAKTPAKVEDGKVKWRK